MKGGAAMNIVTVTINGKEHKAFENTRISELMSISGAAIDMPCAGLGKCGKCLVIVKGKVSPPSTRERELLCDEQISKGVRMACMTYALGDCEVIGVSDEKRGEQVALSGSLESLIPNAPMFKNYGAAVDIGTTTVALSLYGKGGKLLAKEGVRNPQRSFGADVISRMQRACEGHSEELSLAVAGAIEHSLCKCAESAGIDPLQIDAMVIVGNTAMLSLLTKTDTSSMLTAPFTPKRLFGEYISPEELGFTLLSPDMKIYLPPCISAYIGADTVSALLACGMNKKGEPTLFCDIGTNGEMALISKGRIYCASAAAGPAFEGAGISSGSPAIDGAISSVSIVNGRLSATVIGKIEAESICGSGIIDALACLLALEELDETGALENGIVRIDGNVTVDQEDIRALQLAKSAIHAGMRTLMRTVGINAEEIEALLIAGGFGSYVNVKNASAIGLIPSALKERTQTLGNAALEGGAMLLLDSLRMEELYELVHRCEVIELTANPIFFEEYMDRMTFEED